MLNRGHARRDRGGRRACVHRVPNEKSGRDAREHGDAPWPQSFWSRHRKVDRLILFVETDQLEPRAVHVDDDELATVELVNAQFDASSTVEVCRRPNRFVAAPANATFDSIFAYQRAVGLQDVHSSHQARSAPMVTILAPLVTASFFPAVHALVPVMIVATNVPAVIVVARRSNRGNRESRETDDDGDGFFEFQKHDEFSFAEEKSIRHAATRLAEDRRFSRDRPRVFTSARFTDSEELLSRSEFFTLATREPRERRDEREPRERARR